MAGLVSLLLAMLSCSQGYLTAGEVTATAIVQASIVTTEAPTATAAIPTPTTTVEMIPTFTDIPKVSRTPKPTRTPDPLATPKPPILYYTQSGDTLPSILARYSVNRESIQTSETIPDSGLINPNTLLIIPNVLEDVLDSIEVMPDSEVVFSPSAVSFDISGFIENAGGYLSRYDEVVGSKRYTGAELVERVSLENSINPYLLLAILEFKSHWVYGTPTNMVETEYPMGYIKLEYQGLYKQLSWTVSQLSIGYYGWRAGILTTLPFADGTQLRISPGLNAGSVAVQYLFARWYDQPEWIGALYGDNSLPLVMNRMFGDYWVRSQSVEPLYPPDLQQPDFQLPFYAGRVWSYTGGPHSAWGPDGALSAIDFAPPSSEGGCAVSNEWVTAMASGLVVRSGEGIVMLDLDGDGIEQTGWNIMYLHIETRDRAKVGAWVEAGDKIGHPSCEGGMATGTHTHITRKFNGEWILADGPIPFVMDGYRVVNGDKIYEGYLVRDGETITSDPLSAPRSYVQRP